MPIKTDELIQMEAAALLNTNDANQTTSMSSDDDLTNLPAFGMWADRNDMENPTEWVQNLRRGRYADLSR